MTSIGYSQGASDTKTTFCKIQTISSHTANTIESNPFYVGDIDTALHDKVFDQPAHIVIDKSGYYCRIHTKTLP